MMISPEGFVEIHKDKTYKELLPIRDDLIADIKDFEANFENRKESDMCPSPEVRYQCDLEYLGKLCELISEKYNREYVWGEDEDE